MSGWECLLHIVLFVTSVSDALLLNSKGDVERMNHETAAFGPTFGSYSVTGPLFSAIPPNLCMEIDLSLPTKLAGKVALVYRGSCAFLDKAVLAQKNGAVGMIVADPTLETTLKMGKAVNGNATSIAAQIRIPCVFVAWSSFLKLQAAAGDANATVTLSADGETTSELPTAPRGDTTKGNALQFAGLLLLSLPCLWCIVAVMYIFYKKFVRRRERLRRLVRAQELPIVNFRPEPIVTDAVMSDRVHNDSCAICLTEFDTDEPIALLPCNHGFHRECLAPWLDRSALCPICKQSMLSPSSAAPSPSTSSPSLLEPPAPELAPTVGSSRAVPLLASDVGVPISPRAALIQPDSERSDDFEAMR